MWKIFVTNSWVTLCKNQSNWILGLFLICLIFHNTAMMIYKTKNLSNDTTESNKGKRPVLMIILIGAYSWNKMWPIKKLSYVKM